MVTIGPIGLKRNDRFECSPSVVTVFSIKKGGRSYA
jgi:hypothetical protein